MYAFEKLTKQVADYFPGTSSSSTAKTMTHFLAGSIAASVAVVSCQPMDVLRTRFVGQGEPKVNDVREILDRKKDWCRCVDLYIVSSSHTSCLDTRGNPWIVSWTHPSDHPLCSGLGLDLWILWILQPRLAKISLAKSWYGLVSIEQYYLDSWISLEWLEHALNGGAAGLLAKLVVYPFDLTKKRLEVVSFEEARSKFGQVLLRSFFRWMDESSVIVASFFRLACIRAWSIVSKKFCVKKVFAVSTRESVPVWSKLIFPLL